MEYHADDRKMWGMVNVQDMIGAYQQELSSCDCSAKIASIEILISEHMIMHESHQFN
jgi:hypothetical protein